MTVRPVGLVAGLLGLVAVLACGGSASPERSRTGAPAPAAAAATAPAPLRVEGTSFVSDAGPIQWRGITAFRLLDYIADGDEARASQFLAWVSAQKLTVVRVLGMMNGLYDLPPDAGRAALPRLLDLAAQHGVYVELVALAGTAAVPVDFRTHVGEAARVLANHPAGLLQLANEPGHPTQHPDVHKPEFLRSLADTLPEPLLVSLGSVEWNEGFSAGDYVTWHVPRDAGQAGWGHVLAIATGADYLRRWGKPVVSDEPIGAGARFEPGRRDDNPARFRAAALLTRLAGLGATFHYEGGLQARIPEGRELECFQAWNEAWTLLPPDVERQGTFRRSGEEGSVVRDARDALAAYERMTDREGWALVIGPEAGETLGLSPGWRIDARQDFEGARLFRLVRSP